MRSRRDRDLLEKALCIQERVYGRWRSPSYSFSVNREPFKDVRKYSRYYCEDDEVAAVACDTSSGIGKTSVAGDRCHTVVPAIAGRSKMPENTVGTIGVDDEVAVVVCDTSSCIAKASVAGDPRHTVFPSIAGRSKMPENTVGTIGDDEVVAVVCDTSSSIAKASVAGDPRHTVFPSIAGRSKMPENWVCHPRTTVGLTV